MRAYRTGLLRGLLAGALSMGWVGTAGAVGGLVTPDGNGAITASRAMVVRTADEVVLNVQMRYQGTPANAVWLVPVPDVLGDPAEAGYRSGVVAQETFDELARSTWPVLVGECEGMPAGGMQQVPQIEVYGPANQMALPTRFFTIRDMQMGSLDNYLDGLGITLDEAMQAAVTRTIDENFMLAAVRIDTAGLGVDRVDPVVSIRYPAEAGDELKLGLRMLEPSTGMGPADLVLWMFGQGRARANFNTAELDFGQIRFISPSETDYLPQFDMQVGVRQTQMFVIESARAVDGGAFADPELSGAADGTGFVTRLRVRPSAAVLRNNMAFVSFAEAGVGEVSREHAVQSFGCGMAEPDMGPAPDMGGEGDMGPAVDMDVIDSMDGGGLVADGGGDDDGGGGGGGAGGCVAAPGLPSGWPALFLLSFFLCLPGLRRRG